MRRDDEDAAEGCEPLEEVGPAASEVDANRAEIKAGALEEAVHDAEIAADQEVSEQFPVETIPMGVDPTDGMPIPLDNGPLALAAPFTIDTVVCVEDEREYVEVWRGENDPGSIENLRDLRAWSRKRGARLSERSRFDAGVERDRLRFATDRVTRLFGVTVALLTRSEVAVVEPQRPWWLRWLRWLLRSGRTCYVVVRPRRERCRFFKRQVFSNDDQPDATKPGHKIIFSNCTVRRSVGGAFMSLRDEGVYACDYREPYDAASVEEHLDIRHRRKLRSDDHLHLLPLFGLTGEPHEVKPRPPASGSDATDKEGMR
jgi:hypothetical protein